MNASSTAYILVPVGDKTSAYHFTGVISIEHNLALNLDNTSTQGTDIVNGARNLPDQVTLTVVETDVERLKDYVFHTPEDPLRSVDCVKQRLELIERNLAFLGKR